MSRHSTTAQIAAAANALLNTAGLTSVSNTTDAGYWKEFARAAEAITGTTSTAGDTVQGYMLRAATALETASKTTGAEENNNEAGLLKRIVDALEALGVVGNGSLGGRLATSSVGASFFASTAIFAADFVNGKYRIGSSTALTPTTLGPELVTNGGFDSATGWGIGASAWSISGGIATANSVSGGLNRSDLGVTTGKTYEVSFDLSGAGSVAVFVKGTTQTLSGAGRKTVQLAAGTSTHQIDFWATVLPVAIDNVSVREVTPSLLALRGPELVVNGGFDSATGWSLAAETSIANGKASFTGTTATRSIVMSGGGNIPVIGKTYQISFEVSGLTSGQVLGWVSDKNVTAASNGSFTGLVTVTSNPAFGIYFTAPVGTTASVDNFSVREIPATYTRSGAKSELSGPVYGPELATASYEVATGPYDNTISAQTSAGFTTIAGASVARVALTIPTVVGATYTVTQRVVSASSGAVIGYSRSGPSGGGVTINNTTAINTGGTASLTFVATTTSSSILWVATATASSFSMDSISIKAVTYPPIGFPADAPGIVPGVGYWSRQAVTNLFTRSQELDHPAWTATSVTVTPNTIAAPDGTVTADTVVPLAASSIHRVLVVGNTTELTTYTSSVFVKPMGYTKVALVENGMTGNYASFDLTGAGTILSTAGNTARSIEAVGNGWYRISQTFTTLATQVMGRLDLFILDPAYVSGPVGGSWTPDGTSGVYAWQAQLVAGTVPGPIIPTTTAAATVGADYLMTSSPITADEDFIAYVVVNFQTPPVDERPLSFSNGSPSERTFLNRLSNGALVVQTVTGGVFQAATNSAQLQTGTGRTVMLMRRRAGKFTSASVVGGVVSIGGEMTVAFPVGISRLDIGSLLAGQQPNSPIEAVYVRKGTFSDAELTAILAAA